MELKLLKENIESGNISTAFLIFVYEENDFLPNQYINAISSCLHIEVEYIEDLLPIVVSNNTLFDDPYDDTVLKVYRCDCFDNTSKSLHNQTNLVIVCKSITKEVQDCFKDNIIHFPKLQEWQIKDYVYSLAKGVSESSLDQLISLCKKDIYRLDQELSKMKIFTEYERKYLYDNFINDGIFEDLSTHNIFDFSNAILQKNMKQLVALYKEIEKIDVEPLGLVTILYNSLKNIIAIQLDPEATPESSNLPSNRFWAIKKNNCGFYNREQLIAAFYLITDIDRKLKTGEITNDLIIDYIVCHMLSF